MVEDLRSAYQRQQDDARAKEVLLGSLKYQNDTEICAALWRAVLIITGLESSACEMDSHRRTLAACAEIMKARFNVDPSRENAVPILALEIIRMDDAQRNDPKELLRVVQMEAELMNIVHSAQRAAQSETIVSPPPELAAA